MTNIIIILIIVIAVILPLAVVFIGIFYKYRKDFDKAIAEVLYLHTVSLRDCYNIRDLRIHKMKLSKNIETFFSSKVRKFVTSKVYYVSAMCLLGRLEERIQLLEMAGMPVPKIKEDVKI